MDKEKIKCIYARGKNRFFFRKFLNGLFLSFYTTCISFLWDKLKSIYSGISPSFKDMAEKFLFITIVFFLYQIISASKQWKKIKNEFHKSQNE